MIVGKCIHFWCQYRKSTAGHCVCEAHEAWLVYSQAVNPGNRYHPAWTRHPCREIKPSPHRAGSSRNSDFLSGYRVRFPIQQCSRGVWDQRSASEERNCEDRNGGDLL